MLASLNGPGVYMYVRTDRAVYIGSSKQAIGRAFARNHHKRKQLREALEGASLLIFPTISYERAKQLEAEMCAALEPELNERNAKMTPAKQLASLLGITPQAAAFTYLQDK
jgi:hypothetical protein